MKIKEVIRDISLEELKAFLVYYGNQDKSFEMAFKAHFISHIKTDLGESSKYKGFLDELIKPKNAYNKIGPSDKKLISIVLRDFVLQMNDCLSTENYTEAFPLIKESLEKIAYLQSRYEVRDVAIENCRLQFLDGIALILDKELAPVFRNRIEESLKELVHKSYYIPRGPNLIEILNSKNVLVREDKEALILSLNEKIEDPEDVIPVLKTIIQLSHPFSRLASKILLDFNHDKIFEAIKSLIYDGKFEFVDFYINNPEVVFKYNRDILNIFMYVEKAEYKQLNKTLLSLDNDSFNILDLKKICEALPEIYLRKEIEKIEPWADRLPFSLKSGIFALANKNEKLIRLIDDESDVEWLKVYDTLLIEKGYDQQVNELYKSIAGRFIADHIGKKSREYLEKLGAHLLSIGQERMADELIEYISEKYKHRISIA